MTFFVQNVWTLFGKRQAYILFFIHLGTRKVWVSPATYNPDQTWVNQQARNVQMWLEDREIEVTHLIRDRDAKDAQSFDMLMRSSGIKIVKSPVQGPNANAYAEAWVASIRRDCLNHLVCFSLKHLNFIVQTYSRFYNPYRPHQKMKNRVLRYPRESKIIAPRKCHVAGRIGCRSELGGLLKHYYHKAA